MILNSFLITVGEAPRITSTSAAVSKFRHAALAVRDLNDRLITLETTDDGFDLFIGETHRAPGPGEFKAAGTRLSYSDATKTLTVESDRLGTSILFWQRAGNEIQFSNRLENLISNQSEPDWSSIQQYLHTGYTIKDTTLFKGINQTEPNTRIRAQLTGPSLSVSISERETTHVDRAASTDTLIEEISDQLSQSLKTAYPSILMMSAGWDSRTLLLESKASILGAYTHGDLASREISLARELSGAQRMDHLFSDVQSAPITTALVDDMLEALGFGLFPIWYCAAKNIRTWKDAPIMSGVLGELLGGHYGIMSWGSRREKLLSSIALISDSLIDENRILSIIDSYATPPATHWFVSGVGQEILDDYRHETKLRSAEAIKETHKKTGTWQRALEDFNMAHRGRQYILKQAQAAGSTVGYTIPFANEHLTDLVHAIDFSHRVHNKTNRRVLKARRPVLLNAPMAATLINASYPIFFQEVSRAVRVLSENAASMLGKGRPRLGWFNYDHLYEDRTLHEMTDSLTSDIWDKEKMHLTLHTNPDNKIDAGSTLDMLCKIKTVDYYLSRIPIHGQPD